MKVDAILDKEECELQWEVQWGLGMCVFYQMDTTLCTCWDFVWVVKEGKKVRVDWGAHWCDAKVKGIVTRPTSTKASHVCDRFRP